MQVAGVNFAPRKFELVGKEDKKNKKSTEKEEWKSLLRADGAKWKYHQWKFFLVEKEISVRRIRLRVEKTWLEPRVVLKNIRMFE